jgi:DNA-directed RNA polymerase specialized sigma24 family protein
VSEPSTRPASRRMSARRNGSLLNGRLRLGEIENTEAFARTVLDERLRRWGAFLNRTKYDDALSFLIAETWQLYERYDPARGTRFSTYAYRILWRRVASWYRQRFVDNRFYEKPTFVSWDENDLVEATEPDLHSRINERVLTPEGRLVLERIARPMVEQDMSQDEIAARFGQPRRWVMEELKRLRVELVEQVDGQP